ncbi:MAG: hypothetical protein GY861_07085 [bacterium]|nr:hypothetical protein [bacterium]
MSPQFPIKNPETGQYVVIEAWPAEAPWLVILRYLSACIEWVNSMDHLGLKKVGTVHLYRAHIPWAEEHGFITHLWNYGAVHSGYLEGHYKDEDIIIFHDQVKEKVLVIALMMHELMHFYHGSGNEKQDHFLAIDTMKKIIVNYKLINHSNNTRNFSERGVFPRELSLNELKVAFSFLKKM